MQDSYAIQIINVLQQILQALGRIAIALERR